MFALSTAYFTLRTPEPGGEEIVRGALDLGFRALEIDYRVSERQMRQMRPLILAEGVRLVSVHHPYPRDPDADPATAHMRGPELTSPDPDERRAAVARVCESLARAADLGAGVVVLHTGRVKMPAEVPEAEVRRLEDLFRRGRAETAAFRELRERVARARRSAAPAHLDPTLSSLDRVANEAERRGVRVGLENRFHPHEIPDREELGVIFRELAGAPLGYWHDTGHAASLVALGFLEGHTELVEAFRGHLLGLHLHDADGLDDHKAPGEGSLDFGALATLVAPDAVRVLEVHPRSPAEALRRAPQVLAEAGLGAPAAPAPEEGRAGGAGAG